MTAKTEDSLGELKMNLGKKDKKKAVPEKSKDRLEILEEIERLEREGKFDVDPEKIHRPLHCCRRMWII